MALVLDPGRRSGIAIGARDGDHAAGEEAMIELIGDAVHTEGGVATYAAADPRHERRLQAGFIERIWGPGGARFFPDAEEMFPIYRTCGELGLPVIFHGGRAGIEPDYAHQFTLIRHYEGALRAFPDVQFVLAHAGARDVEDAIDLADRYPNVWYGIHGQGVTMLERPSMRCRLKSTMRCLTLTTLS